MINQFLIILKKEWLDLFRSKGLIFFVFYLFVINIYIAGEGINIDARGVNIGILDEKGNSVYVTKIVTHFHPPEFKKIYFYSDRNKMYEEIKNKKIMAGLIFPKDFDRFFSDGKRVKVQLLLDTTVATLSYYTYTCLVNVINNFQIENIQKGSIIVDKHRLFNQNSSAKPYISLRELISAITLLSMILTASVFVREKDQDTWDFMLLAPVNSYLIILSKIISQVLVIMVGFFLSIGVVLFGIFQIPVRGSFTAFIIVTFLYSIATCGIGLFIASISKNITQVGLLTIFILIPLNFFSGGTSPIYSKPAIIQFISYLSPLRYYTETAYNLVFRGTEIKYMLDDFLGISIIALILFIYGVRKIGRLF